MKRQNHQGFSVFELIVIISVLSIVALGGWNIYHRSHKNGEVSTTKVTSPLLSSVPVISTTADLDKVSQTLDQAADSSGDTAQLDSDLAAF